MKALVLACAGLLLIGKPVLGGAKCVYTTYSQKFEGRRCADGSRFSHRNMTVASRGFAYGTRLLLRYGKNGKAVVRVTDTGRLPLHRKGRPQFDVTRAVARKLGLYNTRNGRVGSYEVVR